MDANPHQPNRTGGSGLRQTLDQLYDGVRTGRYRWDQLYKTEKTSLRPFVGFGLLGSAGSG